MKTTSNCCGAPIWQRDPITGHGHCFDCGEPCTPEKEENDMSKEKKIQVSYRIPADLKRAIEQAAAKLGISQNAIVSVAVREYLNKLQTPADAGQKSEK